MLPVLLLISLAISGCGTNWSYQDAFGRPGAGTAPPKAVTKPESTKSVAAARTPRNNPREGKSLEVTGTDAVQLSIIYRERLLVPQGSTFTITVTGAGATKPTVEVSTTKAGPPYAVSVPVSDDVTYPLKIDVQLKSTYGHTLKGSGTVREKSSEPVEILISTS
ncbi:DUF4175 domain-containing protein [Nitratireductor sp. XY-223]|uniref:DUF4175 domain-containing protein n=1 Tax=Nitratireductor sp. XY-223 TaxID=2561926 RepID=UPI0010AAA684|nr:DUF4175 domain-containing protein [Nitratireductor sp. XY-223]